LEIEVFKDEKKNEQLSDGHSIVVYNDDVNTFEWVIESLIEVCNHDYLRATQCAWIIHLKGKCNVKNGEYVELELMTSELLRRNINAEIE